MTRKTVSPLILEGYFDSGFEEAENPFITENSRGWGKYAALAGAITAFVFLVTAYFTHFLSPPLTAFFLVLVYFFAGTPSLIRSLHDLFELNVNIQVLMTLAALLSVLIGSELEGGLLLVLFALSEALEETVTKKTKGALNSLHKLSPTTAYVVLPDHSLHLKSVREVTLDAQILVKAGEIIPLDGIVLHGSSYVNLSHLTGESVPVSKTVGDEVQAGGLNQDGSLTIRVTKTSAESTLSRIIRLISEAHASKPRLQRLLDQFSKTYATSIILLAFCFGAFLPLVFDMAYVGKEGSIYRALAFLIAASPCALIIATPTAYLSAISSAARKGILLKGGIVLDAIAKCKSLAFDKTGTLTTGKLTFQNVEIDGNDVTKEEGIAIAAGLERAVVHPIASAICKYAEERKIPSRLIEDLKVLPGKGVEGLTLVGQNKCTALVGNPEFILNHIQDEAQKERVAKTLMHSGYIVTLLLVKNTVIVFHLTDEIRPKSLEVVAELKRSLQITILTGDHLENASYVAEKLGITNVYADLKPEDKLRIVRELALKHPLMMVGDGINDAPALTQAMVGVAMGEIGSGAAIEAADVVLLRDDLSIIHWLHLKAKKTVWIVRQNLALALFVIFLATTLSLFGIIPLWLAVILHEGSTVTVGCNSLRLLRR